MTVNNYAKALYELEIPSRELADAAEIVKENPELRTALASPAVSSAEKYRVIDAVFPAGTRNFVKYLCDRSRSNELPEIIKAYYEYSDRQQRIIRASLVCVEAPSKQQLQKLKAFICKRFHGNDAHIDISFDKDLIGGFILTAEGVEFDRSLKSSLNALKHKLTNSV